MADPAALPRRLTTILAADVANYSGLMSANEESTLATLKAYRGTFEKMFERHGGRLFDTAGDSILAEFGSAVEAVRCAIAIQDELQLQNSKRSPDVPMLFRIGINIGDVLVDGDNLYGDGVNVAARLEALAQPGGICTSASVYELVKSKVSFDFEDIGQQSVKNIPEPIRAYRLEPRGGSGVRRTTRFGRRKRLARSTRALVLGGLAAAVVLVGLGVAWRAGFTLSGEKDKEIEERKAQAIRMKPYVGMTAYGKATFYKKMHFSIQLQAKGVAKLARRTAQADKITWEVGRWFVTKSQSLCVEFTYFGRGQTVCRKLQHQAGEIKAVHLYDARRAPWVLKK